MAHTYMSVRTVHESPYAYWDISIPIPSVRLIHTIFDIYLPPCSDTAIRFTYLLHTGYQRYGCGCVWVCVRCPPPPLLVEQTLSGLRNTHYNREAYPSLRPCHLTSFC